MNHVNILNACVEKFSCRTYLEIGCAKNICFDQIRAAHKVGVDPQRGGTVRMTSDSFFLQNSETFDLIFIDGLHESEQVYRDILNSLKCLNPNGTIVVHDLNPTNFEMQTRLRSTAQWTGDCWKAWVKLRRERTDLSMFVVNVDFGVGILRRGLQKLIDSPSNPSYFDFNQNKGVWLNLVGFQEFNQWFGDTPSIFQ